MQKPRAFDRIRSVLKTGPARLSPLHRWMLEHRDEFAAALERAEGKPNWSAVATILAEEEGLTDGNGNPPTAKITRQTWWRIVRASPAVPGAAPATKPPEPIPATATAPQGIPPAAVATTPAPPAAPAVPVPVVKPTEPPRRIFRASGGERDWTKTEQKKG